MAQGKGSGLLYRKLIELGYENITQFIREHREIHLSFETVRRAILQDNPQMENIVIAELMLELDFTPAEIAAELKRRGDRVIHRLVAESCEGTILTGREKKFISLFRASKNPKLSSCLEAVFALGSAQEGLTENDDVQAPKGARSTNVTPLDKGAPPKKRR